MKTFKGRPIIPGSYSGKCMVSKSGLNLLASFKSSILKKSKKAICMDQSNPNSCRFRNDATGTSLLRAYRLVGSSRSNNRRYLIR